MLPNNCDVAAAILAKMSIHDIRIYRAVNKQTQLFLDTMLERYDSKVEVINRYVHISTTKYVFPKLRKEKIIGSFQSVAQYKWSRKYVLYGYNICYESSIPTIQNLVHGNSSKCLLYMNGRGGYCLVYWSMFECIALQLHSTDFISAIDKFMRHIINDNSNYISDVKDNKELVKLFDRITRFEYITDTTTPQFIDLVINYPLD